MLTVLVVCALASVPNTHELTLRKSRFLDYHLSLSGHRSSLVDVNIPLYVSKCLVESVSASGAVIMAVGCDVLIEGTDFHKISASSAIVLDCPTEPVSDTREVTGPQECRLLQSGGTLTVRDATFTQVTGNSDGGAIRAQDGTVSLFLSGTTFDRCTTSRDWGAAVFARLSDDFSMDDCRIEGSSSAGSIVHVVLLEASQKKDLTITGCWFVDTTISGTGDDMIQCGGSGLEVKRPTTTTELPLSLVDCHFQNTRRSQSGAGGAHGMHQISGSLTLKDCTFDRTSANNGGCVSINQPCPSVIVSNCTFTNIEITGDGGIFFCYNNQPTVFTIEDSVVEQAQARNGAFIYKEGGLSDIEFTMTNTTLDTCVSTATTGNHILKASCEVFVFTNNTLRKITDPVQFTVKNTSIEFSDCTFEEIECENEYRAFIIQAIQDGGVLEEIALRNCQLFSTKCAGSFNGYRGKGADIVLEDCVIEDLWMGATWCTWMANANIQRCTLKGGREPAVDMAFLAFGEADQVYISTLTVIDVPEPYQLLSARATISGTVKMTDVIVTNTYLYVWVSDCLDVLLDQWNVTGGDCWIAIQKTRNTPESEPVRCTLRGCVFTDITAVQQCAIMLKEQMVFRVEGCEFRNPKVGHLFEIMEGSYTFTNCCFQGVSEGKYYLWVSGPNDYPKEVVLEHPMCFDKAQENSIYYPPSQGEVIPTFDETMFNCMECELSQPTSDISEFLETSEEETTSEDQDPSEEGDTTSEDQDPSEEDPDEPSESQASSGGSDSTENGLPPGAIAGIAIAVIAVVAAVVAVLVVLLIRRRKGSDDHDDEDDEMFDDVSVTDQETMAISHEAVPEDMAHTNPFVSVPASNDDFSSVFEEEK